MHFPLQLGVDLEDLYLNGDEKASQVKEFNSSDTFAIGDIVTNNKKLYKFIKAHTAGAWNAWIVLGNRGGTTYRI